MSLLAAAMGHARAADPTQAAPADWVLLLPGSLDTPTGGYRYDRRMVLGLRAAGQQVSVYPLSARFPQPDADALAQADAVLRALPDGQLTVIDGLALGAMPELAAAHAQRLRLIALVHHPLALEAPGGMLPADPAAPDTSSDTPPEAPADTPRARARLQAAERHALAHTRGVIVTSPSTARELQAHYGVPADVLHVVLPGTARADMTAHVDAANEADTGMPAGAPTHGRAAGGRPQGQLTAASPRPWRLLCVATLTPRKGHDVLFDALDGLPRQHADGSPAWTLALVGATDRDPAWAQALRQRWAAAPWRAQVQWHGAVDDAALAAHYAQADAFVLASHHEGYGMVLAEALAHGLPVISTTAGAIPDTVPAGAGRLVPPGDAPALRQALAAGLQDPALRQRWQAAAREARAQLPTWEQSIAAFGAALQALAHQPLRPAATSAAQATAAPTVSPSERSAPHPVPPPPGDPA